MRNSRQALPPAPAPEGQKAPKAAKPPKPKPSGKPVYLSLVGGALERHATWEECRLRVHGVAGAKFKKVSSPEEERQVLEAWGA